jgi:hypothetical protein
LTEDQLLLCWPELYAFSFDTKSWLKLLDVSLVKDVVWNEAAFSKLTLPGGFKNMVLAFIEGHALNKAQFDDIIEGKGLGLIMLLVGPPGTGKTLTAEAGAGKVRKPLYVLSAGELGNKSDEVESELEDVLSLAARWDAVLLLDECDVFLQKRTAGAIEHNAIVSVFLR